ncbi:MAG TPA: LPS assembly lipoprotein LptE [Steroidobacteraceae bacterium]|nr:LPS assembly lipoprotein LptE [Steroidobacteraceae bacterium]
MARPIALLLIAALVGGCGFHLQGAAKLSPLLSVTYVEAEDTHTPFHRSLVDALDAAGVRVATDREQATTVVSIKKDQTGQHVLSVSAQNTPREYEVFYTVTFTVNAGDKILLAPQTVTLTRDYSFDERALLAKGHEEELLRAALANDIVGIVMRRLASL